MTYDNNWFSTEHWTLWCVTVELIEMIQYTNSIANKPIKMLADTQSIEQNWTGWAKSMWGTRHKHIKNKEQKNEGLRLNAVGGGGKFILGRSH
jgi:hypothetical protein